MNSSFFNYSSRIIISDLIFNFQANLSLSHHQKHQLLTTLGQYLNGHDNLKKVINSPALDHHGKLLSRDGTKIFTAGNFGNGNKFSRRNNRNGNSSGNQGKKNQKNNRKRKSNDNQVFDIRLIGFTVLTLSFQNRGDSSRGKSNDNGDHWCRFHESRGGHHANDCYLNKKSPKFKGDKFLEDYETKNARTVKQDSQFKY